MVVIIDVNPAQKRQTEGSLLFLPVNEIFADPQFNCRGEISPANVQELVASIREHGLIQPVVVRSASITNLKIPAGKKWHLAAGFRRYMAHLVGEIPIIKAIESTVNDIDARILNLNENILREELDIIQEARAVASLRKDGLTTKEIQDRLSQSFGWVQIRTMLYKLPEQIQEAAKTGAIIQNDIRDLYSHCIAGVKEKDLIEMVRGLVEDRDKGHKVTIKPPNRNPTKKYKRKEQELFTLQDYIREAIGNGLPTRIIAWVTGFACDDEIFEDLDEYVKWYNQVREFVPIDKRVDLKMEHKLIHKRLIVTLDESKK